MQQEENYQKAADFIRAATQQGAHLAVLPEYHLLNWVPDDPGFKEACGQWETYLKKYQDLAKECNINIVPGTILELLDQGTDNERLLNVAYFIDNNGAILGRYVKKNLWGPIERHHLVSSSMDSHDAFDTPIGKVGMLICWDLGFPEAFRELISQGAKIIIIPTFWMLSDCSQQGRAVNPTAEVLFLDSVLTARCFENTCGKPLFGAKDPSNVSRSFSYRLLKCRRATR
jgi:predicted amidohydrolase